MVISFQPTATTDPLIEGNIFQSGYAYLLKAAGEVLKFSVESEVAGVHRLIIKARTNTSATTLTGRTYGLKVNGAAVTLKYKTGSASPLTPVIFGGASWGEYEATATLIKGLNTFEIKTNNSYGGVDYIELIPANEPKTYTEEQLKSPEMATWLSKALGLFDKEDLEKAKQEATIAARVNYVPVSEVQTKIAEATAAARLNYIPLTEHNAKMEELKDGIDLVISENLKSQTPIIQTQARVGYVPESEVQAQLIEYKNKVLDTIEKL